MKPFLIFLLFLGFLSPTTAQQLIDPPANTNLTITSGLSLPSGKAIQVDGNQLIRLFSASSLNIAIGKDAGLNITTGIANVMIGPSAGALTTTGQTNFFMGNQAGYSNQSGSYNVFVGNASGSANVSGQGNVAIGDGSGNQLKGSINTLIGQYAGFATASSPFTGNENTYIGYAAGFVNTSGIGNTGIGRGAGASNTTGNYNTFIGYQADALSNGLTNAIAIGANAKVSKSNAIVLGGTGASLVSVGIGNTSPNNRLEITHGTSGNSGLRFTNLTSANAASASASRFLTVNASGDVILASYAPGAREAITSSDLLWERKGDLLQSVSATGVVIGNGITKRPAGYSLLVSGGILAEKVKVALHNTADWSDHVFSDSYKLRSVDDLASYVKANKHLPGIPSATTVVKEGVDLGQMNARLLEKVEELTLYIIQQQQQIQRQQQQINQLQQVIKPRK